MIAVDTNILVYAHRTDSPHHEAAWNALRELAEGGRSWGLPWPCVHEFLAITTHPRIYQPPSATATAHGAIADLLALPNTVALAETANHLELLTELLGPGVVGAKVDHARIAAICLGHGVEVLLTADRDLSFFPRLRTRNPLV